MTIDQLRKAHRAQPFKPFALALADGREITVTHPECLMFAPDAARTFGVASSGEDYRIIDALLVVSIDFVNGRARRRR